MALISVFDGRHILNKVHALSESIQDFQCDLVALDRKDADMGLGIEKIIRASDAPFTPLAHR